MAKRNKKDKRVKSTARVSRQPIQVAVNKYLENPNEQSAEEVLKNCEKLLFWYIHYLHINLALAPDIMQEAKLAVWRSLQNYQPEKAMFTTYLHKSVLGIMRRHVQKLTEQTNEAVELTEDYTFLPWQDVDESLNIKEAVDKLPRLQKTIIELSYLQGFNLSEIAQQMKLTPIAVSLHRKQALEKLKEYLQNK
jgi:RNA polymerase sigma-70 factor, ECF subfamily